MRARQAATRDPGRRRRRGMTLVEVLIAGVLFIVIISIAGRFFAAQNEANALQKALDEASDNARIALEMLSWDLQNAGYRVTVTDAPSDLLGIRATDGGAQDALVIRYLDESLSPPSPQRISYNIGDTPGALQRVQYSDDTKTVPSEQPTVARVVGLNLLYETRSNQYVDVQDDGTCPTGTEDIGSPPVNCRVPWTEKNVAERLVKTVRVQLLARSDTRVPGYQDSQGTYTFADGSTVSTQPGYVYRFADQTVLAPNLGR